jgi:septal ring factor EnvC (AmiA/AmiB activator)
MLPAHSLPEYLKDGKPTDKDDPADRVADGKYVRPLRDYQVLFDNDVENRTVMDQRLKAVAQDANLVKDAVDQAQKQEEACKTDIATAKVELAKITRERNLAADVSKAIDSKAAEVRSEISKLLEKNQAMAGHIAQQQLEAAERIDQRTRAMAQSGTRGR